MHCNLPQHLTCGVAAKVGAGHVADAVCLVHGATILGGTVAKEGTASQLGMG